MFLHHALPQKVSAMRLVARTTGESAVFPFASLAAVAAALALRSATETYSGKRE